jgi:hypothetical protein
VKDIISELEALREEISSVKSKGNKSKELRKVLKGSIQKIICDLKKLILLIKILNLRMNSCRLSIFILKIRCIG